uniref:Uncharacterized protein n=1 Tax=Meloidogyne enterolobii TaxID=390850 RepID=A0A6V7XD62_MELEN|nr:unnamed protein product [Meloidogyne enterolobii]
MTNYKIILFLIFNLILIIKINGIEEKENSLKNSDGKYFYYETDIPFKRSKRSQKVYKKAEREYRIRDMSSSQWQQRQRGKKVPKTVWDP